MIGVGGTPDAAALELLERAILTSTGTATAAIPAIVLCSNTARAENRRPRPGPGDDLDRDDAVAAEREEGLVDTDPVEAEWLRQDPEICFSAPVTGRGTPCRCRNVVAAMRADRVCPRPSAARGRAPSPWTGSCDGRNSPARVMTAAGSNS